MMTPRIQTLEWLNARIDALEGEAREAVLFGKMKQRELAAERVMRVKLAEALQVAMTAVIAFGDCVNACIQKRSVLDGRKMLELMSNTILVCKERGLHNTLIAELSDASRPLPPPDAPS